jgi:hypothetical protein
VLQNTFFSLVYIALPSQQIAGLPESKASLPFSNNVNPSSNPVPLNAVTVAV